MKTSLLSDYKCMSTQMSFDISEKHNDEPSAVSPSGDHTYDNFVEEFMDKVSVKTIMGGSRSIGRQEARIMLAQFRDKSIEQIRYDDPGVLMLDGLAIAELEEFLQSGGESLEFTLRGDDDASVYLSTSNQQKSPSTSTIANLKTILSNYRMSDLTQKNQYREEFFTTYQNMSFATKQSLGSSIQGRIDEAMNADIASQETLLMTIILPDENEEEKDINPGGNYNRASSNMEGYMGGTGHYISPSGMSTGTGKFFGENRKRTLSLEQQNKMRVKVMSMQASDLKQWIFKNLSSQHVWFFIAGFALFWIFFIQTWVDYAYGEMWRAGLMELLCLSSILICTMEAETEFIKAMIHERLYNYYQFLATVEGRTWFYAFLCFLAVGKFTIYDFMAVVGGLILFGLTLTRFILYTWSETCIDDFCIQLHNSALIRKTFNVLDEDEDGYLLLDDIDNLIDVNFAKCCCCRGWLKEIIFWRMDAATNDGKIDIHEFVQFCLEFREKQMINQERRDSKIDLLVKVSSMS